MHRLRELPWAALRGEVVLPAVARVLDGAAAEREVDRALRAHPGLSRDERAAAVEAIFGVALWRRRLWREASGSRDPAVLLLCFLRDLAGVPQEQAAALASASPPPLRTGAPGRLADRWSLPDWLEADLLSEPGLDAEAVCGAGAGVRAGKPPPLHARGAGAQARCRRNGNPARRPRAGRAARARPEPQSLRLAGLA